MKFVVYQNVKDYDDVFSSEIASFDTEADAEVFREVEERTNPFDDVFYTIEEE